MNWLSLQTVAEASAQTSVERMLNALPEGILITLFVWGLLRVLRQQNSGTRFAVWFLALLTVAALPILDGLVKGRSLLTAGVPGAVLQGSMRPAITIPGAWALALFLLWAVGAGVALLRLMVGISRLRHLRRSCIPVVLAELDPAVRKTVAEIIETNSVIIATSEDVRVPAAIGFWTPTIVLPAWALRELPPEDLNVILLHEFAHLRRGDGWTNLTQKMVSALFFFHPAVWWIETRLAVEREMACDDVVLAQTANPRGYATCLVSLLEKSMVHRAASPRWSMAQAAVHRAHEAALRLARILDKNRPAATGIWKPAVGMVGAFSLICLVGLSQAPQFIAFDHAAVNQPELKASRSLSASASQILPVALRTNASSAVKDAAKAVRAHAARREPVSVVAAQMPEAPPAYQVVNVSAAAADPEAAPQFQTLVFIQTTQFVTYDSSVWRVQVWRVTLLGPALSPSQNRWLMVPVAHSI